MPRICRAIANDDDPVMSAANIVEISIVLRGLKKIPPDQAERWLDDFVETAGIRIEPVTQDRRAWPAQPICGSEKAPAMRAALNYGDCSPTGWQRK